MQTESAISYDRKSNSDSGTINGGRPPQTLNYIHKKLKDGYSENIRISNTEIISYDLNENKVKKLVNEAYHDLIKIGTSECQIIWAIVSQKYSSIIQTIEWNDLPIIWKAPE
jgi:hypothetical protein